LLAGPSLSARQAQVEQPAIDISVTSYRLRNGLRVVLSPDPSLPIVAVVVAYGAGSAREKEGQAGLAYFVENMMFQGSENVGPLQHIGYIQKVGGDPNAQAGFDRTLFYQTLPGNQLALALWLESDRMRSLSLTTGSVEKVRQDLLAEIARRISSDVYSPSLADFDQLLYPDFLYGHPLVSEKDIKRLEAREVAEFYAAYYVPNNAVLCITGSFQPGRARELVARYFESIPPGPDIPVLRLPEFKQEGEVTDRSLNPLAISPGFFLGYRFYPLRNDDTYALKVMEYVLLKGRTSRLYSRLLKRDRTAYSLNGWLEQRGRVSALKIFVLNNNEVLAERSRKALIAEMDRLRTTPVPEDELERARMLLKADFLRRVSSRLERAVMLAEMAVEERPFESFEAELERYLKVGPQQLLSLAGRGLVPEKRVVLNLAVR
jgi:predicted Zn-dependent peptidase